MKFIRKNGVNTRMLEKNEQGIFYLQFDSLEDTGVVKHLFSTRIGGVSSGELGTMNLSYTRGDKKENVDENFRRIAKVMNCEMDDFVLSDQTHTTNIRIVTKKDKGKGITRKRDYQDIDGLITNEKGIVLSTFFADCVPLFFVDPIKKVIALSHSGWKGTVNKIGKRTVDTMCSEFGCKREDIITAIGPSICKDCYEVSEDVANQFKRAFDFKQLKQILEDKGNGKYQLDLWCANKEILLESGILLEHIRITDICTSCNRDLLFSHRASNGHRGNLGAFMSLI